jgi:FkbM family methyltransferase
LTLFLTNTTTEETPPNPTPDPLPTTSPVEEIIPKVNLISILKDAPGEYVVGRTKTEPPFLYVGPASQPILDYIRKNGFWSPMKTQIIREMLRERCQTSLPISQNPLVIDVGANLGMHTVYSSSFGCRVMSYEPVPDAFYFLRLAVFMNGYEDRVILNEKAVDKADGESLLQIRGDWGVSIIIPGKREKKEMKDVVMVQTVALSSEIKEDVLLLKIDVEGYEDNVWQGMVSILNKYNIENIIVETKKNRDFVFKVDFINELISKSYLVLSYREDYSTQGVNRDFVDVDCYVIQNLVPEDWFPWEDLWFLKIGSPSYEKAVKTLKCLN